MHRAQRVADLVRRVVAPMIREGLRDPRIGFVTLTDVRVSSDLRHARLYVTILDADRDQSLQALNRAVPFLRKALSRESSLRFTPELKFFGDDVEESGARLDKIFETIRDEERPPEGESD